MKDKKQENNLQLRIEYYQSKVEVDLNQFKNNFKEFVADEKAI